MIFIIFWFVLKKIAWFERGFEYLIGVLIRFACKQVLAVYTLTNQPHSCCRNFSGGVWTSAEINQPR